MGSLKREVSLSLQDIHSVLLLCSPLCQVNRMRSRRWTDGRTAAGRWSTFKSFLLITIWHAGRGKQSALQPILTFSCTSILSQQILSASDTEIPEELRTKIYHRDQIRVYLHFMSPETTLSKLSVPQSTISRLQLIWSQTEIKMHFVVKRNRQYILSICWVRVRCWWGWWEHLGVRCLDIKWRASAQLCYKSFCNIFIYCNFTWLTHLKSWESSRGARSSIANWAASVLVII